MLATQVAIMDMVTQNNTIPMNIAKPSVLKILKTRTEASKHKIKKTKVDKKKPQKTMQNKETLLNVHEKNEINEVWKPDSFELEPDEEIDVVLENDIGMYLMCMRKNHEYFFKI